ncbi:YqiA/YcfP family alpha/beta fold hydrolase [Thalassotalea fusca]
MSNILYIHGFNSSPLSYKAERMRQYLAEHLPHVNFICPQVASSPSPAIAQLEAIVEKYLGEPLFLIGSSLGGYLSTFLAQKYQLNACLVNPAIRPYELLSDYIGWQENPYTNEKYQVEEVHMTQLKAIEQQKIDENRYLVMVQTGDEVLDYRQAVDKFQNSQLIVQQGGDHSFVQFEEMLPVITRFFQLQ